LKRSAQIGVPLVVFGLLAVLPKLSLDIPIVLNGPLDSPGTLQLLGLCLLFAGIALSYDVLFGFTGLLSFGHALYVALGVYMTAIALTRWEWGLWPTLGFVVVIGLAVPFALGAVSLRVGGIAFAMVTLAFAQAGNVLVQKNPYGWTGGEEGTGLDYEAVPDAFVGVLNTKNLYWLALGYAVLVFVVVRLAVGSSAGHVWRAVRENEQRVEVIGLSPYPFKLIAFTLAGFLAVLGGIVWLLLIGGATPEVTTANFTLALLVMVVLGGAGTRYGAMIGGFLYTLLDQRLGSLAGSSDVQGLPDVLRVPLSEPLFLLGALFIALVFFVPGGLASLPNRLRGLRPRRPPLPEEAAA
jgi:branched-chain amino acid transport system permease protein